MKTFIDSLLYALNAPELNRVFKGYLSLTERRFENLPEHALRLIDDKAQRYMLFPPGEIDRRKLWRSNKYQILLPEVLHMQCIILPDAIAPQIRLVSQQRIANDITVNRLQRQAYLWRSGRFVNLILALLLVYCAARMFF